LISTFGLICFSKFRFIVSKKIIDIWKGIWFLEVTCLNEKTITHS
jgi:hypothetical protein